MPLTKVVGEMAKGGKRRMLGVFCNPRGTAKLSLMKEQRDIQERIQLSPNRDQFQWDVCPAATVDDLGHSLLQESYNLIHFSGHGDSEHTLMNYVLNEFSKQTDWDLGAVPKISGGIRAAVLRAKNILKEQTSTVITLRDGEKLLQIPLDREKVAELGMSALAFEGDDGELVLPPPAALVNLLCSKNRPRIECIVLNACNTHSLGQMLIENGVKYVICASGRISDECASAYTKGFYDSLCSGLSYPAAHDEALLRVKSKGVDTDFHGSPTLLVNEMVELRSTSRSHYTKRSSSIDALSTLFELSPSLTFTARAVHRLSQAIGFACDAGVMEGDASGKGLKSQSVIGAPSIQAMSRMGSSKSI